MRKIIMGVLVGAVLALPVSLATATSGDPAEAGAQPSVQTPDSVLAAHLGCKELDLDPAPEWCPSPTEVEAADALVPEGEEPQVVIEPGEAP